MVTRIRQLLDWQQLSPTQFADLIGVGRPVVSHILSERNKPSLEVVQRIIAAFPAVSLPWLLSGSGAMLHDAAASGPVPATVAVGAATPKQEATQPPQPVPTPLPVAPAVVAAPAGSETARAFQLASPAPVAPAVSPLPSTPVYPPVPLAAPAAPTGPAPARFIAGRPRVAATPTPLAAEPRAFATAAPADVVLPPVPPVADYPATTPAATAAPSMPPGVVAPAASLLQPNPAEAAALLPFLGEPGKAIRRIVIFYRDGSFADYQPEA